MRFDAGQTIVRRVMHPDGRIATAQSAVVVADDDDGLAIWVDHGAAVMRRVDLQGTPTRALPLLTELAMPHTLMPGVWQPYRSLMVMPPGAAHSVWWRWLESEFVGWYVNLERPLTRWSGGIDVFDQQLDILVTPDRTITWKDEEGFAELTGDPRFWDVDEAAVIRAEAERLHGQAARREGPFDGPWRDFRPDPAWAPAALPYWWDVPATA